MKRWKLFPLVVIAAGLLAYQNSLTSPFIGDYFNAITENPTIRHLWPIWEPLSPPHRSGITVEGRPIINLSLAINYALGGLQVWGYHALNLTVHLLAGLTLLGIVRRTLLQPALRGRFGAAANELALATAVLWTVHPLQTESVMFLIQRAESIMGLFYLLTIYCFIRGVESQRARLWYGLCATACALGMASKEVMASAPLMVMLYDRAFLSGSFREVWRRRWPLYLALASTWVLLGFVVASGQLPTTLMIAERNHLSWWEYLATQPGVILYYLRLSVWPSPLCLDRGWPIARTWMSIVPPTVVVVILLGATTWAWRRNPVWGFLGAWFFLILAPSSSFIPLRELMYEHRMYLPLAAVVSVVVMGLYTEVRRLNLTMFLVVAIGLGFLTWRRNEDYRSEIGIRADAVAKFPNNPAAQFNLGVSLARAGWLPEAIGHYEQALRITPDYPEAHNNLGVALQRMGRVREAVGQYERALQFDPDYVDAHYNLGSVLRRLDRIQEAIAQYEQVLRLKPDAADVHNDLGTILQRAGRVPEAIGHYEQALRIKPDSAEGRNNLAVALQQMGRVTEAIAQYEQALRLKPDSPDTHNNLAVALQQAGRVPEAINHYERALQLKPDNAEVHNKLGNALLQTGRLKDAAEHYERALRIAPNLAEAENNLAWLLAALAPTEGGDPVRAVTLAEQVCKLAGERDASQLDTLAVAYASAGRFNDAIATSQAAVALARTARRQELVKEIEARLQLYREGHPYRMSVGGTNPPKP